LADGGDSDKLRSNLDNSTRALKGEAGREEHREDEKNADAGGGLTRSLPLTPKARAAMQSALKREDFQKAIDVFRKEGVSVEMIDIQDCYLLQRALNGEGAARDALEVFMAARQKGETPLVLAEALKSAGHLRNERTYTVIKTMAQRCGFESDLMVLAADIWTLNQLGDYTQSLQAYESFQEIVAKRRVSKAPFDIVMSTTADAMVAAYHFEKASGAKKGFLSKTAARMYNGMFRWFKICLPPKGRRSGAMERALTKLHNTALVVLLGDIRLMNRAGSMSAGAGAGAAPPYLDLELKEGDEDDDDEEEAAGYEGDAEELAEEDLPRMSLESIRLEPRRYWEKKPLKHLVDVVLHFEAVNSVAPPNLSRRNQKLDTRASLDVQSYSLVLETLMQCLKMDTFVAFLERAVFGIGGEEGKEEVLQAVPGLQILNGPGRFIHAAMEHYNAQGQDRKVLWLFEELDKNGIEKQNEHYFEALKACKSLGDIDLGISLIRRMEDNGLLVSTREYELVIDMCAVMKMSMIQPIIEEMEAKGVKKTLSAYDALIKASTLDYDWESALKFMRNMYVDEVEMNEQVALKLLFVFGSCKKLDLAWQVFEVCMREGLTTIAVFRETLGACRKNKATKHVILLMQAARDHQRLCLSLYAESMSTCLEAEEFTMVLDLDEDLERDVGYLLPRAGTNGREWKTICQMCKIIATGRLGLHSDAAKSYRDIGLELVLSFSPRPGQQVTARYAELAAEASRCALESAIRIQDLHAAEIIRVNSKSIYDMVLRKSKGGQETKEGQESKVDAEWMAILKETAELEIQSRD